MIIALHGFLGLPSDWDDVLPGLKDHAGQDHELWTPHLWADARSLCDGGRAPGNGYAAWVSLFLERLRSSSSLESEKPILVGYSMGGRLAMHAAVASPDSFKAVVFISSHPGLTSEAERAARCESDAQWMKRFVDEPWAETLEHWNSQSVLAPARVSSPPVLLDRSEESFDRMALATGMGLWSLGRQDDLRHQLQTLPIPALYMTGGQDGKFTALISGMQLEPYHRHVILMRAGHRLPWDDPRSFRACLQDFLDSLPSDDQAF